MNSDDVDVEGFNGVMSPNSEEKTRLEDIKAQALKKSQKKGVSHIYNTLNRTNDHNLDTEI